MSFPVRRRYELLRVPVAISSTEPPLGPLLDRLCVDLPPAVRAPVVEVSLRATDAGYAVWVDEDRRCEPLAFDQAVMKLLSTLHDVIMERCPLWAVHAGVVARGGRVVAFPGRSGLGKSTLAGACVRAGWAYVSDEALAFDPATLEVVPYPKPLWMDREATRAVGIDATTLAITPSRYKYPVTPQDLGGRVAGGRLRLAALVVLEPGSAPARLEPLRRAPLATLLLRNTFRRGDRPEENFTNAVRVAGEVDGYRLAYVDPPAAVSLLDELL